MTEHDYGFGGHGAMGRVNHRPRLFRCPACGFELEARASEVSHLCKHAPRGSGGRVILQRVERDAA